MGPNGPLAKSVVMMAEGRGMFGLGGPRTLTAHKTALPGGRLDHG